MNEIDEKREELIAKLDRSGRIHSSATVMFHTVLADRFGLNATDWKCQEYLDRFGPMTAGQLAEATGLTSGAITGVVDRLEKRGFVRREHDPSDRRKVVVRLIDDHGAKIDTLMGPMTGAFRSFLDSFSTEELELLLRFMEGTAEIMKGQAERLKSQGFEESPESTPSDRLPATED